MNQTLKLFLILSIFFVLQACSDSKPTQLGISQPSASPTVSPTVEIPAVIAPVPAKFNRVLAGTIDNKHAIQMELNRNAEYFYGRYFYEKNAERKYLDLGGKIDGEGNVSLAEMDGDKETGYFTGKLINEIRGDESALKFTGNWSKTKNGAGMPVALAERQLDLGGLKLITKEQSEENKKQKLSIQTAFPQLAGSDARAEKFNKAISEMIAKDLKGFKDENKEVIQETAARAEEGLGSSMETRYSVMYADKNLISLLFSTYSFTGGAHGNTATTPINYDLNRGEMLKLANLFQPNANYLKVISAYCIAAIKKRNINEDQEWIQNGAGPKAENYQSWSITPQGLVITFDAYQVAAYAVGPQEIVIPYSVLKPILKPDSVLANFAK